MLTSGVGGLQGADPSPLPQSLATGSLQPASVHLHNISKKEPPVWTYPGASRGHLGVTVLLSEVERLCLQMSASPQALPHGSLALTSCHCETAPCEPVHGPACGPCDQGLSQPSRPSVTRISSPEYNSAMLPETLGAIPNFSSDGKCSDFGVCRSGYLAASLYPACPGAQRHRLGVITRQLQCYQALGSSAVLVVCPSLSQCVEHKVMVSG